MEGRHVIRLNNRNSNIRELDTVVIQFLTENDRSVVHDHWMFNTIDLPNGKEKYCLQVTM